MNKKMTKEVKDEKLKIDEIQSYDNLDLRGPSLEELVHSSELRSDGSLKEFKARYLSKDGKSFIEL